MKIFSGLRVIPLLLAAVLILLALGYLYYPAITASIWNDIFKLPPKDAIIARVNGEAVYLSDLELQRSARQANQPDLDTTTAYREAMKELIRLKVLVQEARRRGLSVSEAEARAYWAQMQEALKAYAPPEMVEILEEQRKNLGLSQAEYEARLLAVYQRALLVEKLHQAVQLEASYPTEAEVDAFLAGRPGGNILVLIPIRFNEPGLARQVYEELQSLTTSLPRDQFEVTLAEYVRKYNGKGSDPFIHETYVFNEAQELPEFARAALQTPEGSLGIYEQTDGAAIVYYVLKSLRADPEEARIAAYQALTQEKLRRYWERLETRLIEQARVEYFPENLPEAARSIVDE
jgi:hypothetical protein